MDGGLTHLSDPHILPPSIPSGDGRTPPHQEEECVLVNGMDGMISLTTTSQCTAGLGNLPDSVLLRNLYVALQGAASQSV